jgi:hypothetical protein
MNQEKATHEKQSSEERNKEPEFPRLDMSQPPAPPDIDAFRRRAGEIIANAAAAHRTGGRNQE